MQDRLSKFQEFASSYKTIMNNLNECEETSAKKIASLTKTKDDYINELEALYEKIGVFEEE